MASKRVSQSAVDWANFSTKILKQNKVRFERLKTKNDIYVRSLVGLPNKLPAMPWDRYSSRLSPAMLQTFQKQYEALKVPYPMNTYMEDIAKKEKVALAEMVELIGDVEAGMKVKQAELDEIHAMVPFEEMTLQEFYELYPEHNMYNEENGMFYPHLDKTREPLFMHDGQSDSEYYLSDEDEPVKIEQKQ